MQLTAGLWRWARGWLVCGLALGVVHICGIAGDIGLMKRSASQWLNHWDKGGGDVYSPYR